MRVVIAEDSVLLREGLSRLLLEAGMEVPAAAGDAETFLRMVGTEVARRSSGRRPHATHVQ